MAMGDREREANGSRPGKPVRRAAALVLLMVGAACTTSPNPSSTSSSSLPEGGAGSPGDGGPSQPAYTMLTRGAHPLAQPQFELGPLDPSKRIENLSLVFKLSPEQVADRTALLAAVIQPGSPQDHQWLTPEDYASRFGAKSADIDRAVAWLKSQGLDVYDTPSRLGARVTFAGTVATLEAAFRTQMNRYLVRGETHYAMSPAPSIPTDLADIVLAIHNTHDFYPRPSKPKLKVIPSAVCPTGGLCNGDGIAPPDWATIYDVNSLYTTGIAGTKITGAGVTIAVVGITEISQTDLTAFRTRYGLATNPITMTLVPNTGAPQSDNGAGLEAVLDTEWSGGIAQAATINYVYTGANDGDVDDATYYAIEQNFGGVLSESWAGCEEGFTTNDADVLETFGSAASLLGITYVAASGDDGAAACQGEGGLYVNMPASFPGVTAVGGTGFAIPGGLNFNSSGNVTGYGTETVWNEFHDAYTADGVAAGGGGISSVFTRPSYQGSIPTCTSVGTLPTGVTPSTMREVPDVALTAASGSSQYGYFIECTFDSHTDDCTATGTDPVVIAIGGTSASTPSFAGVMALANQATGGRMGNVNPLLYLLNTTTPSGFHDITTGNNEVTCKPASDPGCPAGKLYGYAATTGYDCASGLGSIDATNLVTQWATLTPTSTSLTPSVSTTSEGASITLTATVDVLAVNPNVLGGAVTFTFESYLNNGDLDLSWPLGTTTVTGTTTSGTASLSVAIPPGMVKPDQAVDVVAMYGGDATHLASVSAKSNITFSPISTLCSTPPTTSVAEGATFTYSSSGGVPPVRWYIDSDSTCNASGDACSSLIETTGVFTAGTGEAGYVLVAGIDSDGAEVYSEVTVGSPTGTAPWAGDAGILTNGCCTPITKCPAPDNCGTISNGCGGTISCGTCTAPQTCTGNVCGCTPITSCPAGDNCGTVSNGCGGTINCGTCTAPQTCTGNVCGCTPITTCPAGDNCGTAPNGCGGTLNCGTCAAPQTCGGGGKANECGCTAITTCPAGENCGTVPNGCGGTLNCGTCAAPQTCGGGGKANECGCIPLTACPAGDNCGTVPNGCGGTLNCGTCPAPLACGGSGTPNACGCTPLTVCPAGDNCGTVPNGCGGTLDCGTCAAPLTCGGGGTPNACGCTPLTACPAGDNCGTVSNGCGGTLSCGSCSAPETCGGSGISNVCGCTPITTCPAGDTCGTVPDGCGGTLSCAPGCSSDQTCTSNHCVANPVDGGRDSGSGTDSGRDTGTDASKDSGEEKDSSAERDSGKKDDGGKPASDSGANDSAPDGGDGYKIIGGCGCRTAKPISSSPALAGFGALFLLGGARARRRRRREGARSE
jgi:Pro-kumamolisin, activation domain